MSSVCTAAGLPVYWKRPVFDAVCGHQSRPIVYNEFTQYWKRLGEASRFDDFSMTSTAHDEAARFVWTLTSGSRETLLRKHFDPMILDIIHSHPGLAFYREAEEFHQKYVQAVSRSFPDLLLARGLQNAYSLIGLEIFSQPSFSRIKHARSV